MASYVVAGSRPWNRATFDAALRGQPGGWHFVATEADLTPARLATVRPRYVFFLHWSARVPDEIIDQYECVCFHMTDVPYGRGGSPLQNLIIRGHETTQLTALRMVKQFDAGPVYLKEELCLHGTAEEVYIRASNLSARMALRIIAEETRPVPQTGEPTVFRRRTPAESELPAGLASLDALHDFVRMLDAEGYPKAFLRYGPFTLRFSRATRYDGKVVADVTITRDEEPAPEK